LEGPSVAVKGVAMTPIQKFMVADQLFAEGDKIRATRDVNRVFEYGQWLIRGGIVLEGARSDYRFYLNVPVHRLPAGVMP
jgi:hypothetical protein